MKYIQTLLLLFLCGTAISVAGQSMEDRISELQESFADKKQKDPNCCREYLAKTIEFIYNDSEFRSGATYDLPVTVYNKVSNSSEWTFLGNADDPAVLYEAQSWANLKFAVVAFYVNDDAVPGIAGTVLPLEEGDLDAEMDSSQGWKMVVPRAIVYNQFNATSVDKLVLSKIAKPENSGNVELYVRKWAFVGGTVEYSIAKTIFLSNEQIKVSFKGFQDIYVSNPYKARIDKLVLNPTVEYEVLAANQLAIGYNSIKVEDPSFSVDIPIIVMDLESFPRQVAEISFPGIASEMFDVLISGDFLGDDLKAAALKATQDNAVELGMGLTIGCLAGAADIEPVTKVALLTVCTSSIRGYTLDFISEFLKIRVDRMKNEGLITAQQASYIKLTITTGAWTIQTRLSGRMTRFLAKKYNIKLSATKADKVFEKIVSRGDLFYNGRGDFAPPDDPKIAAGKYVWGTTKVFFYLKLK
jgi:hypothetical protein